MAELEDNKSGDVVSEEVRGEESVDEILAGIYDKDGSYSEEFNDLLARYTGNVSPVVSDADISDRSGEAAAVKEADQVFGRFRSDADVSFENRLPDSVRDIYSDTAAEAQRPMFTADGGLKYPTLGVGDAEERVVFDADWEKKAKEETARLERVRRDRMLRGDSAYARSFITRGVSPVHRSPFVDRIDEINTDLIDSLSDDDDFDAIEAASFYTSGEKKPFFREGFSAGQKNNFAAGGETEKKTESTADSGRGSGERTDGEAAESLSWLRVDVQDKKKKKHRKELFRRSDTNAPVSGKKKSASVSGGGSKTESARIADGPLKTQSKPSAVSLTELRAAESETRMLKESVAEIVEKYNRRAREDELKNAEESARREREEKGRVLGEEKRRKELSQLRENVSRVLSQALDSETVQVDDYSDFSLFSGDNKEKQPRRTDSGKAFPPSGSPAEIYSEQIENEETNASGGGGKDEKNKAGKDRSPDGVGRNKRDRRKKSK